MIEQTKTIQSDLNVEMELNMIDASFKDIRNDISTLKLSLMTTQEKLEQLESFVDGLTRDIDNLNNKVVDFRTGSYERDIDLLEQANHINARLDDVIALTEAHAVRLARLDLKDGFDSEDSQ